MSRTMVSAIRRRLPGDASQFILPFSVRPGQKFVLCCRISNCDPRRNLSGQEANLRHEIESRGGIVVGVVHFEGSGFYPYWLARAAAIAERHDATLLAESTDRFVRNPGYHSNDYPDAQARITELQDLKQSADGRPLMTLLHPNAPPSEVRSLQTKRGLTFRTPSQRELRDAVYRRIKELPH